MLNNNSMYSFIFLIFYSSSNHSLQVSSRGDVHAQLNQLRKKNDSSLVITGQALEVQ